MPDIACQQLPELKTERLTLRPVTFEDVDAIERLGGEDYEIARWLTGFDWPYVPGSAGQFLEALSHSDPLNNEAVFAIMLEGSFIGVAAIEAPGDLDGFPDLPSLGYWLGRPFQKRGFATEAAEAVLRWGFAAHNAPRIGARVFRTNLSSRRTLAKLGFVEAGACNLYSKVLQEEIDNIILILDRNAFASRQTLPSQQMPAVKRAS